MMPKTRNFLIVLALALCVLLSACAGKAADTIPVQIDRDAAVVSYLGPEGTYTQEACGVFFEQKGRYVPYKTVDEAVHALITGESNYAVIPQENTIGGAVTDYLDVLIAQTEVSVVGEIELPISQNLLVLPGAVIKDIKRVYSHKQGITQGTKWLQANLPDAELVEVSSTAEGAKKISEGADPSCAAIASAGCAEVYGLEILAADIQENDNNKTRFYVLSTDAPATAPAARTAFLASGDAANLPALMAEMQKQNMTLVAIHDRPMKTELGKYAYLIEYTGGSYDGYLKLTKNSSFEYHYLGSFDVR